MFRKLLSCLLLSAFTIPSGAAQKKASSPSSTSQRAASVATPKYSAAGRQVQVYTTAENTPLRLAAAPQKLAFQAQAQPLETQPTVFVDPTHAFQTLLGIGGALTDAAAETFARLPKAQQQELLQAYYSPTKGIGYTLARTSIHS
ncbi:hypothetical protein, partial [Hymenobacter seoulensis]